MPRRGNPPYLFSLLFHAGRRKELLRSGAAAISVPLGTRIIMDVVFQLVPGSLSGRSLAGWSDFYLLPLRTL
jgi:hypothetical protein